MSTIGPIAPSGITGGSFGRVGSFGVVVGIPVLWSSHPAIFARCPAASGGPAGAAPRTFMPTDAPSEPMNERRYRTVGWSTVCRRTAGSATVHHQPPSQPPQPVEPREVLLDLAERSPSSRVPIRRSEPASTASTRRSSGRDRVRPAEQAGDDLDRLPEGEGDHRPEVEDQPADRDEAEPQRLEERGRCAVTSTAKVPSSAAIERGDPVAEHSSSRSSGLRTASRGPLTCSQNPRSGSASSATAPQEVEQLARLAADRVRDQPDRQARPPDRERRGHEQPAVSQLTTASTFAHHVCASDPTPVVSRMPLSGEAKMPASVPPAPSSGSIRFGPTGGLRRPAGAPTASQRARSSCMLARPTLQRRADARQRRPEPVHQIRAAQPVDDEGEPLGRLVPVAELLVHTLREDPELFLEEDRERHRLPRRASVEPLVLPLDLLDQQAHVRTGARSSSRSISSPQDQCRW